MSDKLTTHPLVSMVSIDPESLPVGTNYDYQFHYFDISSAANGRLQMPDVPTKYSEAPSRARRIVKNGDVLMSTVRPNLKAFAYCDLPEGNYVASTGFAVLRAIEGNDPRYILYSILSDDIERQIDSHVVGSNYPAINSSDVKRLRIPNWKPSKQRRIAEILSTLDANIEKTETLIAKYQQIKAGLMHDLFTRGITADGKLRPPHESVKTKFGWMPREWRIGSLLEATDPARQPILTGPFGADLGNDDFIAEGSPVLRIGNVQQGHLKLDDLLFVREQKALALARYRIKTGDLLFARQGATTGRNALANDEVDGFLINYHIIRVALDHGRCSPLFIEAAFNSEIIKRQIERDKGRGTREGINTAQLTSLAFPLAPVEEQRRIAEILSTHERAVTLARSELGKFQQQKRGLMHDLLTGKVRVMQ